MKDWIFTAQGQQSLLRVYRKISKKKQHEILTMSDFRCGLLTPSQVKLVMEHLIKIDVVNRFESDKFDMYIRVR